MLGSSSVSRLRPVCDAVVDVLIERMGVDAVLAAQHVGERGVEILDGEETARRRDVVGAHHAIVIAKRGVAWFAQHARGECFAGDQILLVGIVGAQRADDAERLVGHAGAQQGREQIALRGFAIRRDRSRRRGAAASGHRAGGRVHRARCRRR